MRRADPSAKVLFKGVVIKQVSVDKNNRNSSGKTREYPKKGMSQSTVNGILRVRQTGIHKMS